MASPINQPIDDGSRMLRTSPKASNGESVIDSAHGPIPLRYCALAWLTSAAALAYLCRNAVGVPESAIREQLGLTLKQSGWFMGAFFCTYAIFQIPSAWFTERFGTRIALTFFVFASSVAMLAIGLAPGFRSLLAAQLVMGVAQAGLLPATIHSIGQWMPLAQRSAACGILSAGMGVGAIAAGGLTGTMSTQFSWRIAFIVFAIPGFAWAAGFYRRFRDDPTDVLPPDSSELELIRHGRTTVESIQSREVDEVSELTSIVLSPTMWWLCGQQICRSAGAMFFASWFPTFLQKTRGISVENSGYLQSLVLVGGLLGGIFGGVLTDWIWRETKSLRLSRSGVGSASLACCALLTLCASFVHSTGLAILLLALGVFCAATAGACAFAAIIDIAGPRVPQATGIMNMTGNFAAAACPIIVAKLFQATNNWNVVLLLFAGIFFLGAICWLMVNPQQPIKNVY